MYTLTFPNSSPIKSKFFLEKNEIAITGNYSSLLVNDMVL